MTDEKIVAGIQNGEVLRDQALKYLFDSDQLRKSVSKLLFRYGAQQADFSDIYIESILSFDKQVINKQFKGQNSKGQKVAVRTYITAIARNQWLSRKHKNRKITFPGQDAPKVEPVEYENPETFYLEKEKMELDEQTHKILLTLVKKLDERCQVALRMSIEGQSMEAIRKALEFKKVQGAANKTHRCRKRLRKMIKDNIYLDKLLKSRI